ncbi:MAG: hypothetical protein ACXWYN_06575, partial [Actinomycetota bacterium]
IATASPMRGPGLTDVDVGHVRLRRLIARTRLSDHYLRLAVRRRNDSESLNRGLEDTLFLGRAHSLGWRRQQVEMLGWALMVNALTMARHRAAEGLEAAA